MQYDFNLGPNGSQRIEAQGRFFKYATGTGKIKVTLDGGRSIELIPGQGIEGEKFSGISIQDKSGFPNSGVMLAGDFKFTDNAMQAEVRGSVEIVDSGTKRTMAGNCFLAGTKSGATAARQSFIELENPVGSGKSVVVDGIWFAIHSGTANVAVVLMAGNLSEATYPTFGGSLSNGRNKRGPIGTNDTSTATVRARTAAAGAAVLSEQAMFKTNGDIYHHHQISLNSPIVVQPGYTLLIRCEKDTESFSASFEFREELGWA
ncbi:MAG: hypothetical protein ACXW2U_00770 [Telluria sp.]